MKCATGCKNLPVSITIVGNGCMYVGMKDYPNKQELCGPGVFDVLGLGPGVVQMVGDLKDGTLNITHAMGIPKTKNTKIDKPVYKFFYPNFPEKQVAITFRFATPVVVNTLEPSDSVFASGRKKKK